MANPLRAIQASLAELRRRSVFRIGAAYLVGAFGLLQLVSAVQGALGLTASGMRLVIIALLIGFPVALFLAWAFDLGPGGVHRDRHDDARSNKWVEFSIITALTVLVSAIGYTVYRPEDLGRAIAVDDKSIAVLPFANLSDDPANEYFGDGIAEELLNVLAKQPDLRVAARTSSFAYKGKNEDVRRIGNELNVATVLEGSIRKQGDRVRITAQLINVADGYHLWSETYDRTLDDIFAIQDEIAGAIGNALKVTLLGKEAHAADHLGTRSVTAYDLYLLGRHRWRERNEEGLLAALDHFQRAIAADPGFARAYSGLADTYLLLTDHGDLKQAEGLAAAERAVTRALELDPQLAEAHASLGLIRTNQNRNAEARAAFEEALRLDAQYPFAHLWYANVLDHTTERAQRLAAYERALELDPLLIPANVNLAGQYLDLGRFREAVPLYERLSRLQPDRISYFYTRGAEALRRSGALTEAILLFRRALDADPWNLEAVMRIALAYADLGDTDAAQRWAGFAQSMDPAGPLTAWARMSAIGATGKPGALAIAEAEVERATEPRAGEALGWRVVAAVLERDPRAGEFAQRMERQFGNALPQTEGLVGFTPYLAWALRERDPQRSAALIVAGRAFVANERAAGTQRPDILFAGAQLEALAGERDAGIRLLQEALLAGFTTTWALRLDPVIEPLRADPAFEPILAATDATLAAQREALAKAALPAWQAPTRPQPVAIDPARLAGLAGYYSNRNTSNLAEFLLEGEALVLIRDDQRRLRLYPASGERFFDAETAERWEFKLDANGRATGVTLWNTGFPQRLKRVDWQKPVAGRDDPTLWAAFVGTYRIDQKRTVRIWRDGDRLMGQQSDSPAFQLTAERPGEYFLEITSLRLHFLRDADGRVTAMRVIQPDAVIDIERVD